MKAIDRIADSLSRLSDAQRDLANRAMFAGLTGEDSRRVKGSVWMKAYCAALNCEGVKHGDAVVCADKAVTEYTTRFL